MNDETQRADGGCDAHAAHGSEQLAQWLLRLMREQLPAAPPAHSSDCESEPRAAQLQEEGHRQFFQQLPDFVMALLLEDESGTRRYTPLLYHLVGCDRCHQAYLEFYDALRTALYDQGEPAYLEEDSMPPSS